MKIKKRVLYLMIIRIYYFKRISFYLLKAILQPNSNLEIKNRITSDRQALYKLTL